MSVLDYIEAGEPVDDVVSNRALKDLLTQSGLNPDASFPGFLAEVFTQEGGVSVGSGIKTLNFIGATLAPNGTIIDITVTGRVDAPEYNNGNSGTAKTVDFLANGLNQKVTLDDDCTFTFIAPFVGEVVLLKMIQDGTGGWVVTFPAEVNWGADGEPSWVTTLNSINIAVFYFDGTTYWGKALTIGG